MIEELKYVIPGDKIEIKKDERVILLGPGLIGNANEDTVTATQCGTVCYKPKNVYWIQNNRKRYLPRKSDLVVGVVTAKRADTLKVDIEGPELASLSVFAFEGATKRKKPTVQIGDTVYAKVLLANEGMEPELVCVDSYYKAGRLGILSNNGFVFNIRPECAHKLLNVNNPVLQSLGTYIPYEITVGVNGKIWLNGKTTKDVHHVYNSILVYEEELRKRKCNNLYTSDYAGSG